MTVETTESISTRKSVSAIGWGAFTAWVLCGALWGLTFFGMFSIGPVAMPFAGLVSLLLVTPSLDTRWVRRAWIGFGVWLVFWGLLFTGVFLSELPFTLFIVGFIAAVVFARVSGAPGWGLIAGFGIWAIWIGLSVSLIWIVVGILLVGLAGALFVQNREPVASMASPDS